MTPQNSIIEIVWICEGDTLPHITPGIERLVGYSPDEVRQMEEPITVITAPSHASKLLEALRGNGPPNQVVAKTLPLVLRHKQGHEVYCEVSAICRYDADGRVTDIWGTARQLPQQCVRCELEMWWTRTTDEARQLVSGLMALYPPAAVA